MIFWLVLALVAVYIVMRLRAVESKVTALRRSIDAQLNVKDISFLMHAVLKSNKDAENNAKGRL